uniref:Uncharacterized protein n=1 Tax=Arundo donax TaxID=35708 RepID=A0A0A9HFE8_ARUDO
MEPLSVPQFLSSITAWSGMQATCCCLCIGCCFFQFYTVTLSGNCMKLEKLLTFLLCI